jgi:outer membrane lipoprotein-sorting protein
MRKRSSRERIQQLLVAVIISLFTLSLTGGTAPELEPLQCLDCLQERIAQCKDYQYRVTCYEREGTREEERTYNLFAKDARMVRIKVTSGRGRGSEALLDARGRVWGRKGGLLKPFVQSLSMEDRRVRSLRGTAFWESAAHNYLRALRERIAHPDVRCTIERDAERPGTLRLIVNQPGEKREDYWIDAEPLRLRQGEIRESGQLVVRFTLQDMRENVGLSDGFFCF